MACLFCRIVAGEEPAHVVYDTPEIVGFLDTRPVFVGHALLVPRSHVGDLSELPEQLMAPLLGAAKRTAAALSSALGAQGTFVALNNVVSQSVPHLHVHVVPRTKGDGLRGFFWPRTAYDDDAHLASVAEQIRAALSGPTGQP